MDLADDLDITTGGPFMHQTPTEAREIIDHILGNSSFVAYPNEPQQESQSHLESPSSHPKTLKQPFIVQEGDRRTRSQAEQNARFGFMNLELNSCIFVQRLVSSIR